MNQDDEDSRGPINPKRYLATLNPKDIAEPLQQAVHEWPKRSMLPRINQLEAEMVLRGLRRDDPLMGVR